MTANLLGPTAPRLARLFREGRRSSPEGWIGTAALEPRALLAARLLHTSDLFDQAYVERALGELRWWGLIGLLGEFRRVLKPGCRVHVAASDMQASPDAFDQAARSMRW